MAEKIWWELGRNLILPVIVLLILLGGLFVFKGGGFPKVKEISLGLKNYLPGIGSEEEFGVKPELSENQHAAILSLKETMKAMKESGESDCFVRYTPLPPLEETTIELLPETFYDEEKEGTLFQVQAGRENIVSLYEIVEGIHLCVIAGTDEGENPIADNFRRKFIDTEESGARAPYFQLVKSISFQGDDEENSLAYDGASSPVQDYGLLFTPGEGLVCFFPESESKLAEELPLHFNRGELPLCIAKQQAKKEVWKTYTSLELSDYLPDKYAIKTIRQPCGGFVGRDCPPDSYRGLSCSAYFPSAGPQQGCLVTATAAFELRTIDPPGTSPISCSWWESPEGQMLIAEPSAGPRNLQTLPETLFFADGSAATKSEELQQKEWLSLDGTALLCANKQWYECNSLYFDQELAVEGETYFCTEENGVILWKRKSE